jgi:hypothetical protein
MEHAHHHRLHLPDPLPRLDQCRRDRTWCGSLPLIDPTHDRHRVADNRTRGRHQPAVAAEQCVSRLWRPRLTADDQDASPHAESVPDAAPRV